MSYRLVVTQLHNGLEVVSAHQGGSATQAKQSAPVTVGNGTAPSAPVIDFRAMRLQLYGSNYIAELEAFAMGRDPKEDACDMIMSCLARCVSALCVCLIYLPCSRRHCARALAAPRCCSTRAFSPNRRI